MMPKSTRAIGNYYQLKTRKWFEAQGYHVEKMEMKESRYLQSENGQPPRVVSAVHDILAADLIATSEAEVILIQSKQSKGDSSKAITAFKAYPWPTGVRQLRRLVVRWEIRASEPTIIEVD